MVRRGAFVDIPAERGPSSIWHSDPVSATPADVDQDVLAETLAVAARLVGGPLRAVGQPFPGSRRTLVVRTVDPSGRSFVVKRYHSEEGREAYAREASALEALTGVAQTPTLVAESSDPRLVVMGDLGDGTHLADALLGDDADRAAAALSGWATAVAGLHRAGHQVRDTVGAARRRLPPGASPRGRLGVGAPCHCPRRRCA